MMMELFFWIAIFIIALILLLKSSNFFTDAAEKIGIHFGLSTFMVGVTIVAIGTSLPELISSLFAVGANASEIVIGNVVGSNIANILLILGLLAIFAKKIKTEHNLSKIDLPIFFASVLYLFIISSDGIINPFEGIIGILGIIIYFAFLGAHAKKANLIKEKSIKKEKFKLKKEGIFKQFLILIISGIFIFLSAKYTVDSIIHLSVILNIAKDLIAISAVAIGTSLPELAVGIQAIRKGNGGMAFGNVLGSNIFNSFVVLGIPALFGKLIVPQSLIQFSIPFMIGISILFFFTIQDKKLTIWEGIIFLLLYLLYICKIFGLF
jgi:cation:H+ antiporter